MTPRLALSAAIAVALVAIAFLLGAFDVPAKPCVRECKPALRVRWDRGVVLVPAKACPCKAVRP